MRDDIPRIGFGTWQITGAACVDAVVDALGLGYRHLDTARVYENEPEVGQGLAASGVPREDVWLTTKVWYTQATADDVLASARASVADLGVDGVDLLLFHWPNHDVPIAETMAGLLRASDEGLTRHVGVSNFPTAHLREALDHAPVFCNQVEYHPLLGQDAVLSLCRERGVVLAAYAPFAHGAILENPVLQEIAAAHASSVGQVALRWLIEQDGVVALPKAASRANRAANLNVFDWSLTDGDRARIAALPKDHRRFDVSWAPEWDA